VKNQSKQGKKKHRRKRPVLLVATGNRHKVREIAQILGRRFKVVGLEVLPRMPAVIENGRSFDSNAAIKVRAIQRFLAGKNSAFLADMVIADDSGLSVAALNGAPGIHTARYAGPRADDAANRRKLLRVMKNKKNRAAAFHCTIAAAKTGSRAKLRFFRGKISGRICRQEQGTGGFGYDPVFVPRGLKKTFAQLSSSTKNRMSHRARALLRLHKFLEKGGLLRDGESQ